MSWKLGRTALICAGLATMAGGCAEEREPINRVQANALAKSFFVGESLTETSDDPEFWMQGSLIDVGYGASQDGLFTSTYTQGVSRIKWQVTEDLLLGRLTYERVEDSDGKGAGPASLDGQIAVAYKIISHFDIRRAYNPSTGEELNVIEENTSDRPWSERQYMRVDWSQNLQTDAYDFDTLSLMGIYGGIEYSSLAYYVNDPTDADAPFFDVESGYFDVTNKAFATPKQIDLSHFGWGIEKFPACFLPNDFMGGSEPVGNCNPSEITIRQAFRRVIDTDYEPADWDGYRFMAYGGFYVDRFGYARNFGMSDEKWHRFLTRYNVWERSHYYDDPEAMTGEVQCFTPDTLGFGEDAHLDANSDGTEDRCTAVTAALGRDANVAVRVGAADPANPQPICNANTLNDNAAGACGVIASQSCTALGYASEEDPACLQYKNDQCCAAVANAWVGGSRCDTFKQRCTLPYRLREARPLAWYYTSKSNLAYFDPTEWATHEHDVAMRHGMQTAKYAECMGTSGNREYCTAAYPVYFGQQDDHEELKQLSKEVDDCRHGLTYVGANGQENFGAINTKAREAKCQALADTISAARAGSNRPFDPGVVWLSKQPEQIVLCHSPVHADDPAICAGDDQRLPEDFTAERCAIAERDRVAADVEVCRAALNVRRGDLRYHLVNVMTEPQTPSPWGIYTDAEDPLTGETFSAAINVWSHVNDLWSQQVMERIRFIKGELSAQDVTDGEYVHNWAEASEAASGNGMAPKLTREQVDERIAGYLEVDRETFEQVPAVSEMNPDVVAKVRRVNAEVRDVRASVDAASSMNAIYNARRNRVAGTATEAELVDSHMQQLGGVNGLPLNDTVLGYASPLRGLDPALAKQFRNFKEAALAERGTCVLHEAPAPMALTGLADLLEEKFANVCARGAGDGSCAQTYGTFGSGDPTFQEERSELMRNYVAQRAHYAVIVHEMGHSIGERHNFVSSSDAYNYRPQYWQLRTRNGTQTEQCATYTADGNSCVGPRYFDPVTQEESDNLIWMWMHSSVMDYAGEYTQDFLGLGAYDFAAHRMFYGESIAVFDEPEYLVGGPKASGMLTKMDSFGGILGFSPEIGGNPIHYSAIQANYQVIRDCQPVQDIASYRPASWDDAKQGAWHPTLDGLIVPVNGQYSKCRQTKVDYVPYQKLRFPEGDNSGELTGVSFFRGGPAIDGQSRIRVPYGFATDRWADLGNASVYRHDNGADTYEIFDFFITQQEVNHIFDNYRRGRHGFSVRSAAGRTLGRYNEKMRDGAKGLGLLANVYRDVGFEEGLSYNSLWLFAAGNFFPENILASGMAFDHIVRTAARPEVGGHFMFKGVLTSEEDAYASGDIEVLIPDGASGYFGNITAGGKLVENRLSDDQGEFDSDFTINAGSYYDKVYAPYLMAESVDNFISSSRGDFVDGRYRAVSLADLFPEGYRRWLGNALTGDNALKGPRLAASASGTVLLDEERYPQWPIGWPQYWGDEPKHCFPAAGTTLCEVYGDPTSITNLSPQSPPAAVPIDPQIGWLQQKFLIASTLMYLPSNERLQWMDMIRLWELGPDSDPGFANRIEFHDPTGRIFIAKTFGMETIFGKTVQRGIGARVLEYANELLVQAYETTESPEGWPVPVVDADGKALVRFDPSVSHIDPNGFGTTPPEDCNATDNSGCECVDNIACVALQRYVSVPFFIRQAFADFGINDLSMKGVY